MRLYIILCGAGAVLFLLFLSIATDTRPIVGLVYVPSRAYQEQINRYLKQHLLADGRFIVKEFTAASAADRLLLDATCNAALDSSADVLVTTGIASSQVMAHLVCKRKEGMPIIFMGGERPRGRRRSVIT